MTSIILNNGFIKTAVSDSGTFGAGGSTSPGILFDATGAGNYIVSSDWLLPGSPWEDFYISYDQGGSADNSNGYYGSVNIPTTISATPHDVANQVRAVSTWGDLSIAQVYTLAPNSQFLNVAVIIQNNSATDTATNIQYARSIDPDVDSNGLPGSTSETNNTRESSDLVVAEGPVSGQALAIFSVDSLTHNTGVSYNWNTDANFYLSGNDDGNGDNTIGIGFQVGDLAPGAYIVFDYSYIFANSTTDVADTLSAAAAVQASASLIAIPPTVEVRINYQSTGELTNFDFTIPNDTFVDTGIADAGANDFLTYTATLDEIDLDTGEYLALPEWLSLDPITGQFTGVAPYDHANPDANLYQIRVIATDVFGSSAEDSFQLNVAPEINDAPVEDNLYNISFTEKANNTATFEVPFVDADPGAHLTYSVALKDGSALPSWLTFSVDYGNNINDSGTNSYTDDALIFSGKPNNSNVGTLDIVVTANDGVADEILSNGQVRGTLDNNGSIGTGEFTLTINNVNDAPYLAHTIPDNVSNSNLLGGGVVYEKDSYSYTVPTGTFGDIDLGDSLHYSASLVNGKALPSWLEFDKTTNTLQTKAGVGASLMGGKPTVTKNGDSGAYFDIRITATDNSHASTYDVYRLTVIDVNDEPKLTDTQATLSAGTEDQSYFVSESDLLQGFTDADATDHLGVINPAAFTSNGTELTVTPDTTDGGFWIASTQDYNGDVTLSYEVQDYNSADAPKPHTSTDPDTAEGTLTFTVNAVNDAPFFTDATTLTQTVSEDAGADGIATTTTPFTTTFKDVDSHDTHTVSDITATGTTTFGALTGELKAGDDSTVTATNAVDPNTSTGTLTLTYTLDGSNTDVDALGVGESHIDYFTVTLDDGNGGTTTKDVEITVNGVNDTPVDNTPNAALTSGTEDTLYSFSDADLLNGFSDVDTIDTLSIAPYSGIVPDHGDVIADHGAVAYTVNSSNQYTDNSGNVLTDVDANNNPVDANGVHYYTLTPDLNYNGDATLSFDVTDGNITVPVSATRVVTLNGEEDLIQPNGLVAQTNITTVPANGAAYSLNYAFEALTSATGAALLPAFEDPDIFADGVHNVGINKIVAGSIGTTFNTPEKLTFTATSNVVSTIDNTKFLDLPAWLHLDSDNKLLFGTPTDADIKAAWIASPTTGQMGYRIVATDVVGASVSDIGQISLRYNTVNGTAASETIIGTANTDILRGNDGNDIIKGNGGNDGAVTGLPVNYTGGGLYGDAGNDTLQGGTGKDLFVGGADNDTVDYSSYTLAVTATLVAPTTNGGYQQVTSNVTDQDKFTTIENLIGGSGGDTLSGDVNNNILNGGAGNDILNGNAGNDTLIGGTGNDVFNGGAGIDTVDYSASTDPINANLSVLTSQLVSATDGSDTFNSIEILIGSSAANILTGDINSNTLSGGAGDDKLSGGVGTDSLNGGAGNDTLVGGPGADIIDGGAGIDTLDYSSSTDVISVNLLTGLTTGTAGTVAGSSGSDTIVLNSVENVIGSQGANTLTGDINANVLNGNGGNDVLLGDAGNDTLIGGPGNDTINGGAGIDTVDYTSSTDTINVNLATGVTTGTAGVAVGSSGSDTITLNSVENVYGSQGANTLIGDANANILKGFAGNDLLRGGAGNDTIDGGAGTDTLDYSTSSDVISVNLLTGLTTGSTDSGNDTFSNIENVVGSQGINTLTGDNNANNLLGNGGADTIFGSGGNDTVSGGTGNDSLNSGQNDDVIDGGAGTDTLNGGLGVDTLTGGAGADRFELKNLINPTTNLDTITDFSTVQLDKIALLQTVFTAFTVGGSVGAIGAAGSLTTHLSFDSASKALYYDDNITDTTAGIQIATLTGVVSVSASDFIIV